jgi:trehalose synthase
VGEQSNGVEEVRARPLDLSDLEWILGDQWPETRRRLGHASERLDGATVWNINSTARGGGVAEMLHAILAYSSCLSLPIRWLVIGGEGGFFEITKRIHNQMHGAAGDGGRLGDEERAEYERSLAPQREACLARIRPGDWVICHDPQTAGLIPSLREMGARVVWRCHIGVDEQNEHSESAWRFLEPYVSAAHSCVFSRPSYIPPSLADHPCAIVHPSIDPLSAKNRAMHPHTARQILQRTGILAGGNGEAGAPDSPLVGLVSRTSRVVHVGEALACDQPTVVQVSRWDALKDPIGVLSAHVEHLSGSGATLILAGPDPIGVSDDPEGRAVYEQVVGAWEALPREGRARVRLASLPMDDLEENALIVNALQRHATVVVQKSLQEGFGLTVSEAMWKARPVVASAVGGIQDQIEHGSSGFLVHPHDLRGFADAVGRLLEDPLAAEHVGLRGRQRVQDRFLTTRTLTDYASLIEDLGDGGGG